MLTLDRVYKAKRVLSEVVRKTDMIRAKNISSQCDVYLKTENLQVTGSFKVRGSYFKISQLSDEEKAKGVIACSAGNHAQGVALAATKNGIKSLICLPDGAPISKVEATKRYGADVCLVKGVYDDAYNKAIELQKEKGYTFIHPFNDPDVIAGQGTIGLEILEQLPDVDAVVVPIGGGGLIEVLHILSSKSILIARFTVFKRRVLRLCKRALATVKLKHLKACKLLQTELQLKLRVLILMNL